MGDKPVRSTSFRIAPATREQLKRRARLERQSATTLLERLIIEGIQALDHPGVVHRGPPHDRRAALAGGPDVWEVVARLRELEGDEEDRVAALAQESEVHPRLIRVALGYAASHPAEISARIEANAEAIRSSIEAARARQALLA